MCDNVLFNLCSQTKPRCLLAHIVFQLGHNSNTVTVIEIILLTIIYTVVNDVRFLVSY